MTYANELYHHGILGMKWGVRRYQNEDGTLTEAGKKRRSTNKWRIRDQFRVRRSKNDELSSKTRNLYGDRIRKLYTKQVVEGTEVGDWGSSRARKMEDRHHSELNKLKNEATYELLKSHILDAGYDEKSAKIGADWMMKKGYNVHYDDRQWTKYMNIDDRVTKEFLKGYKPPKNHKHSTLNDIDDSELITASIGDPEFRKEYGVSDEEYRRYKRLLANSVN